MTGSGEPFVVYTAFTALDDAGSANFCGAVNVSVGLDFFNAVSAAATDAGDGAGPLPITTRTRLFLSLIVSLSAPEPWMAWIDGYHTLMRRALAARSGRARGDARVTEPLARSELAQGGSE